MYSIIVANTFQSKEIQSTTIKLIYQTQTTKNQLNWQKVKEKKNKDDKILFQGVSYSGQYLKDIEGIKIFQQI